MTPSVYVARRPLFSLRTYLNALAAVAGMFVVVALWFALYLPTRAAQWLGERVQVPTAQMQPTKGQLQRDPLGNIQIVPHDGEAVLNVPTVERIERLPVVSLAAARKDASTSVFLTWHIRDERYEQAFAFASDDLAQPLVLIRDPRWTGTPDSLRLVVRGSTPLTLGGLELRSDSVAARLSLMWHGWFGKHPWRLSDLNFIEAVDVTGTYYFNFLLHIAVLAVATLYGLMQCWRGEGIHLNILLAILLAGWTLGMARWQVDLVQKTWDTYQRYGGKTLHERHLAAEDHEFYWVVDTMRPYLKKAHDRDFSQPFIIYHKAEDRYDVGKLRYYTAPHPLQQLTAQPAAGTVFGVVNRPARFDAPANELTLLPSGVTIRAERLGQRGAAAIYRAK